MVARHQHEEELGELGAEPARDVGQDGFLTGVGAAGDQDERVVRHAELTQKQRLVQLTAVRDLCGLELQAAGDEHRCRPASELPEALGIGLALDADAGEAREERAEEETGATITAERPVGDPGVHQQVRDLPLLEAPEHVRPQLGLDEDHRHRVDDPEGALDVFPPVDGIVDLRDVGRQALLELGHAGGGRGGDEQLVVR